MIIVTGGAGFIGSNLVRALNARGRDDLLVVDDLEDGRKLLNLADCDVYDLVEKELFREWLIANRSLDEEIETVFHLGACSSTTVWDGRVVMRDNYDFSKALLAYCGDKGIPLIYASTAALYGRGPGFKEERRYEQPLNPYALSKLLFDQLVRRLRPRLQSQVVGLRYFNVYGPREGHKGDQRSVVLKLHEQLRSGDRVRLFEGSGGYAAGEQLRDFVFVDDCVAVTLWFADHAEQEGIYNVGTGRSRSFNDLARAVIAHHGRGEIEYVPMPESLASAYQSFTEADVTALRKAGCEHEFASLEEGVQRYLSWLDSQV